jgi:hypothetical protein
MWSCSANPVPLSPRPVLPKAISFQIGNKLIFPPTLWGKDGKKGLGVKAK